ncbi:SusC/RagA family TonB-linked outer membrane protein [Mucilaginibacter ximonensis]|uniref:SusC/RagA family TonB-linked outer membrane protein n=1 Tax=Mucilaginibacter ximonensis TaxID=538021 RepID=A0ABW5Y9F8_9SPHI
MNFTAIGVYARSRAPQIYKVMKLTTFLLVIALVQASAAGFAQKISLNERDAPLEKVLGAIKQQSGYVFLFTDPALKEERITVRVAGASIEEALKAAFDQTAIDYKVVGNNILLKKAEKSEPSFIDQARAFFAQVTVTGKVTDETGQALPGVTVKLKDSNNGVVTDKDGVFVITVAYNNSILVFSSIGFETREISAGDFLTKATITLKATTTNLQEVVVSKGYYSVKQELNTGNVSRVTAADIQKQPVSDPILALEGRVPGVYISQTSGIPGAGYTVMIRGRNSIAQGNNPLYIVDGVPFLATSLTNTNIGGGAVGFGASQGTGMSPFNSLNSSDIESIEVLKDADATAIYGSRGANGVILITTKKGRAGITKFDVNVYSGAGQITRQLPFLNTQQYLAVRHKAFANDGVAIKPTDYDINGVWDTTRYTNWQKELIGGTAKFTNAQASLSGGSVNTQFLISGGYSRQTTVYPGDFEDRKASLHINLNHASADQRFHAVFSAQYLNDYSVLPSSDLAGSINLAPDAPPIYDANGNLNWQNNTWSNPLAPMLQTSKAVTDNLGGNLNLSYQVLPGLQIKSSFGYTHLQLNQDNVQPLTSVAPPNNTNPLLRNHQFAKSDFNTWIIEPQLNYSRKISKGTLDLLVGSTFQGNKQSSLGLYAYNFASDDALSNIAAASNIIIRGNSITQYNYNALYGRVSYNWEEKYVVNATARRDGSSRFGPNNQFGNFASAGAAWIFSKEQFISKNLPFLSFGKLRASYGSSGNDQITDYQYLSTYATYNGTGGTYQSASTLYPTSIANSYFGWESVKKLEGGIELGFLKDRVFISASYYRNRTGNQLVGQPLPSTAGFTRIVSNLPAVVQNTGVELLVNGAIIQNKSFKWSSSVNLTIPRNKLVSFPGLSSNLSYSSLYMVGQPLFIIPSYKYTGIDSQTGLYTFQDVNKDGAINNSDKQFLPSAVVTQKYYGGFENTFSYHGIDLSFLVQFVKQTGRRSSQFLIPGNFNANPLSYALDAWQKPGDIAEYQKYTQGSTPALIARANLLSSDYMITDASFIRLKNISLAYSMPQNWLKKAHLQNLRVYLQCQNLFTITRYQGFDPETQGLSLPPLKMITAGIQLTL